MLLFRSEELIERWCDRERIPRGEALTLPQVWELSQLWYADRMSADYRGRTAQQAAQLFKRAGLTSEFWDPAT